MRTQRTLKLAKGYLSRAETDAMDGQWDGCLANAQEAVENAGKCVLANFRPVPKAHDVDESIERLLKHSDVPLTVKSKIEAGLELLRVWEWIHTCGLRMATRNITHRRGN